ncbi:MAG: hypothetical protein PHC70_02665 [Patescibacteria group bacterium]|nr:hypothetical protein [Patescibacteria group bacterium]
MLFDRRRMALFLIGFGVLLLAFGIWILAGMLWPKKPADTTGNREPQAIQRDIKPQPQTIALVPKVQGTSTAEQVSAQKVSDLQEAKRMAESVVARMGSGTSQDGFLGYDDAMQSGTSNFQAYLKAEQANLRAQHPISGPLYGITTRAVASSVTEGDEGSDKIVVKVQSQKVEDAGDRSKPTNIIYEVATVTFQRQPGGRYLVSDIRFSPANL